MEDKLDLIIKRLIIIEQRLSRMEEELLKVSKHVPLVDNLAESGVVSAVQSLNTAFTAINPFNYITGSRENVLEDIEIDTTKF